MRLFGRTPTDAMSCHQVGEVLQQYLDGEIDADRARRIEAHLDECRRCGMEADTYDRIKATFAAQRPRVPTESVDRLREFGARLARGEDPSAR
jgi:anti-sigma factor (TIGR02949 family)